MTQRLIVNQLMQTKFYLEADKNLMIWFRLCYHLTSPKNTGFLLGYIGQLKDGETPQANLYLTSTGYWMRQSLTISVEIKITLDFVLMELMRAADGPTSVAPMS